MSGCRVLVVDNDPFILSSLVNALENHKIVVAGRAGTAREALEIQRRESVDVALLDLDLGIGPNGLDLAHALRAHSPKIGLVLLSTYRDPRLMAPGMPVAPRGMGYLSKADVSDVTQITAQIQSVASSPLRLRPGTSPRADGLTASQLEVLKLVAQGLSTQAIAAERGVGSKAVEQSIARISEILGVTRDGSSNQRVRLARAYLELTGKIASEGHRSL